MMNNPKLKVSNTMIVNGQFTKVEVTVHADRGTATPICHNIIDDIRETYAETDS